MRAPASVLNTERYSGPYSVRMLENTARKTPNMGTFHAV